MKECQSKGPAVDNIEEVSIAIPSVFGYEEVITEAVSSIAKNRKFPLEKTSKLKLAVAEACINAIEHGNAKDASKMVIVTIHYQNGSISASIQDQGGNQIDENHDMMGLKEQIDKKEIGGWGLFLIKKLVDTVEVKSDPGQSTITTLTINKDDK